MNDCNSDDFNEPETTSLPGYIDIQLALDQLETTITPAELHGLLAASFCDKTPGNVEEWMVALTNETDPTKQPSREIFIALFEATYLQSNSSDYSFNMLLPEDDEPFTFRAEALAVWCQSFLSGLSSVGIRIDRKQGGDLYTAMDVIENIALLPYDELDDNEPGQEHFFEIIEDLRMAVMVVHHELHHARSTKTSTTLH